MPDEKVFRLLDKHRHTYSLENSKRLVQGLATPNRKGMVGITTYIKGTLCYGKNYVPAFPKGFWSTAGRMGIKRAKISATQGKKIGAFTDTLFRNVITGKQKLNSNRYTHKRCLHAFKCLEMHNIVPVAQQVPVCIEELNIKTELDGIGVQPDGTIVVLELKTTQHPKALHKLMYKDVVCKNKHKLLTGLDFTIFNLHQLQTAFGILALKRLLPDHVRVTGRVIVCAPDGALTYSCGIQYQSLHQFPMMQRPKTDMCGMRNNMFTLLPPLASIREAMLSEVRLLGVRGPIIDDLPRRYGTCVVTAKPGHYYLVGILHDSRKLGRGSNKFEKARKQLLQEQPLLAKALKTKFESSDVPRVSLGIVVFGEGWNTYYGVRGASPKRRKK